MWKLIHTCSIVLDITNMTCATNTILYLWWLQWGLPETTCRNTYQHAQKKSCCSVISRYNRNELSMDTFYQATYFNNFLFFHRYHVWFTFQAATSWQQWQWYIHHSRNCLFMLHWYYLSRVRSWMLFQDIKIQWWTQEIFWDSWLCIAFHNFRTPLRVPLNNSNMPSGNVLQPPTPIFFYQVLYKCTLVWSI